MLSFLSLYDFFYGVGCGGGKRKEVNTYVIHRNFPNKMPLMVDIAAVVCF